jgi:hypothetical protein
MNSQFRPGHSGRPKGTKNKLCRAMLDDLMAEWLEGGAAAIKIMRIEEPAQYCKMMASILPRELWLDNSTSDLDDDQLSELIDRIREQLLIERQKQPLQELKVIANGGARHER